MEDHDFVTSDGVRLHYVEAGSGQAIVFIPGWRMPGSIFERQLDFFGVSHRVIALDPRGHGESELTTEGFYKERRAQDIAELLDAASADSAILVGWSMGIPEVLTYVEEFGTDGVRALVLVDWPFRVDDDFRALGGQIAMQYLRDPRTVARDLLPTFFSSPQDEDWIAEMTEVSLRMPTSSAAAILIDYIVEGGDWSGTIQGLNRPLLYTVAPMFADAAEELGRLAPDAVTRVFEGAGHGFFYDRHEEFNRVLSEFIEGL